MADEPPREDPITALQVSAVQQHEMFLAWQVAGFDAAQALELLKAVIMAMILK
jgi:hypothetical protein